MNITALKTLFFCLIISSCSTTKHLYDSHGALIPVLGLKNYSPSISLSEECFVSDQNYLSSASELNLQGVCYFYKSNFPLSEYFFGLAMRQNQAAINPLIYNNLAVLSFILGQYDQAQSYIEKSEKNTNVEFKDQISFNKKYIYHYLNKK